MSKIEVDTIDKQSGSTLTIGGCGTAVQLGTGATQTGFGRTGAVDWQTGSIKTATFTAASGEGYFANTSGSAFNMNLPAGTAGAIVAVADYATTFNSNSLTIVPNGSDKIGGTAGNSVLSTDGQSVVLVFVDATKGWITTQDSSENIAPAQFVAATGGNATLTVGNFKTHVFTSPGTFCVSNAGNAGGSNKVDYHVVAGGGGSSAYTGNNQGMGGGGAGGFRQSNSVGCISASLMSPVAATCGLSVPASAIPVVVGSGGAGGNLPNPDSNIGGAAGSVSTFLSITSAGGGLSNVLQTGSNGSGGSGAGGGRGNSTTQTGGAGNTPPVSPPQGNPGGDGTPLSEQGSPAPAPSRNGGGGGGAGAVGADGGSPGSGAGGIGSFLADAFVGPTAPSYGTTGPVSNVRYYAGGGGGAGGSSAEPGGSGGGGAGARGGPDGGDGTTNTGGGGGGSNCTSYPGRGGNGGSGIVMIRYRFQ
mgnify:CR=1 FL=1